MTACLFSHFVQPVFVDKQNSKFQNTVFAKPEPLICWCQYRTENGIYVPYAGVYRIESRTLSLVPLRHYRSPQHADVKESTVILEEWMCDCIAEHQ